MKWNNTEEILLENVSLSMDSARILQEFFPKIYCDHETGSIFLWCLSLGLEMNVSFSAQGSGAQIHISTHHPVVLAAWITTSPVEVCSLCRKNQKSSGHPQDGWEFISVNTFFESSPQGKKKRKANQTQFILAQPHNYNLWPKCSSDLTSSVIIHFN